MKLTKALEKWMKLTSIFQYYSNAKASLKSSCFLFDMVQPKRDMIFSLYDVVLSSHDVEFSIHDVIPSLYNVILSLNDVVLSFKQ